MQCMQTANRVARAEARVGRMCLLGALGCLMLYLLRLCWGTLDGRLMLGWGWSVGCSWGDGVYGVPVFVLVFATERPGVLVPHRTPAWWRTHVGAMFVITFSLLTCRCALCLTP